MSDTRPSSDPAASAVINYANLGFDGERTPPDRLVLGAALLTCALTAITFAIFVMNGNDEPYTYTIRRWDAFVQVGLSSVLIVFWLSWSAALAWLCRRGRVKRVALIALLWPCLMIGLLVMCADGYVSDLIQYQTPHAP